MPQCTRRNFLGQLSRGAAAATLGAIAVPAIQARGANERFTVGSIGCSGRGLAIGEELRKLGVRIAYACDPDRSRAEHAKRRLEADQAVADLRRILDDRSVDAVAISAPNHWHAPAAILACQAGKHVYVEKPCSHNIAEGRRMIEAARRTGMVMQVGSQIRGTKAFQEGIAMVHEGAIGKVLVAKTWVSRKRPNIGHCQPSAPPPGLDYDLWVGPAPMIPYQENLLHYNWHWWYNFGNGDAGSRGVHQLDIALWGLNLKTYPTRICGFGEKLYFDDDKQYPDTHYVTFEFPGDGSENSKSLSQNRRGLAHLAESSEQNVPVPFLLPGSGIGSKPMDARVLGWFSPRGDRERQRVGNFKSRAQEVSGHAQNEVRLAGGALCHHGCFSNAGGGGPAAERRPTRARNDVPANGQKQ